MIQELASWAVDSEVEAAFEQVPIDVNELGYDPWGLHPETAKLYFSASKIVFNYFRTHITGIEHIPEGRVLIVLNHSGQLPFGGLVIAVAAVPRRETPIHRRWMGYYLVVGTSPKEVNRPGAPNATWRSQGVVVRFLSNMDGLRRRCYRTWFRDWLSCGAVIDRIAGVPHPLPPVFLA